MGPNEQSILAKFLLSPAPLPKFVTQTQFTTLFPSSEQSSREIRRLYRTLQHQRGIAHDAVETEIEDEARRGVAHRRAVLRSKLNGNMQSLDEEVLIEKAVCIIEARRTGAR
jgi:centromere-localized protein 2